MLQLIQRQQSKDNFTTSRQQLVMGTTPGGELDAGDVIEERVVDR
jgi:hypothetical protein